MVKKKLTKKELEDGERSYKYFEGVSRLALELDLTPQEVISTLELVKYVTLKQIYDLADIETDKILKAKKEGKELDRSMFG